MVANLQYGWILFVSPMDAKHHWGASAIQVAFSIFIVTETWLVPLEGWLVDKFGPRPVVAGVDPVGARGLGSGVHGGSGSDDRGRDLGFLAPMRRRFITGNADGVPVSDATYLPGMQSKGD